MSGADYTSLVVVDVDGGGELVWIRGYEWQRRTVGRGGVREDLGQAF